MNRLQKILVIVSVTVAGDAAAQQQFPLEESADSVITRQSHADSLVIAKLKEKPEINMESRAAVDMLNDLSQLYCSFLHDTAAKYAQKAEALAQKINYPEGIVTAITNRGYAEEVAKRNWEGAIFYYEKAIETAKKKKLDGMLDELFGIIHNAYVYQGNFPKAMTIANEGLGQARRRNDRVQALHYTSLVAASYFRQSLYEKSLLEYRKAEELADNLSKEEKKKSLRLVTTADIYYGLADVYTANGDTAKARYYLEKALAGFLALRKDSFFIRDYMISNTLFKKGIVAMMLGNPADAMNYSLAALDSCKFWGCNPYEKVGYYLLAGDALRQTGRDNEAESYLYQAKGIAERIRHAENARDAYYYLALYYADKKKYDSAWHYDKLYSVLKDSIINERTKFRTDEINTIYRIAEKDRQIARQNNQRNILIASFVVLLLILGFFYNRYRLRQRNRYQQELNRQQNELFNAISLAQEHERKRIAQDIHDGLGSVLSAAKLKLAEVKDLKPELATDEKFLTGIGLLDEASAELRSISHNIMPATLSKLGLVPALKNLTEKISSHKGMQVMFIAHDFENRLDEQTEISVYRIILELINNVVKHAVAGKATVQLLRYPDHINITVEDNGKGFDTGRVADEKAGMGLGNVAARVEYMKGKMDIDSMPGKGTTVIVDIPVTA
ncbi:MAG: tetratricopeptide repeat-containing sensor histidine kinase [Bacteroidota bacterium]